MLEKERINRNGIQSGGRKAKTTAKVEERVFVLFLAYGKKKVDTSPNRYCKLPPSPTSPNAHPPAPFPVMKTAIKSSWKYFTDVAAVLF